MTPHSSIPVQRYKLLLPDGSTPQGNGKWPLPQDGQPGEWLPPIEGKLVACKNGYHVLQDKHLVRWLDKRWQLWTVETGKDVVLSDEKDLAREARAVRRIDLYHPHTLQLFAYECADRAARVHAPAALRAAGLEAEALKLEGLAPIKDQQSARAARDAARDAARAAWAAVRAAAGAAGDAAWAAGNAAGAAWAAWAAGNVAWAAGYAAWAARDAAGAAEEEWQTNRLIELLELKAAS